MPTKRCPPSSVRRIDVQGGTEHGAPPSSHHVPALIAVNDWAPNPGGTGPDGAWTWRDAVALAGALLRKVDVVLAWLAGWWRGRV